MSTPGPRSRADPPRSGSRATRGIPAIALSQHTPVSPIDRMRPLVAANVAICSDAYRVPLSVWNAASPSYTCICPQRCPFGHGFSADYL
jgi:hypothetical protein